MGGGDPHFSVLLSDGNLLCYSVQGKRNSAFNLISSTNFLINAKFIPDSKREEVTWMGSIGIVIHKALRFGATKVTHAYTVQCPESHRTHWRRDCSQRQQSRGARIWKWKPLHCRKRSPILLSSPSCSEGPLERCGVHLTIMIQGEHLDNHKNGTVQLRTATLTD